MKTAQHSNGIKSARMGGKVAEQMPGELGDLATLLPTERKNS